MRTVVQHYLKGTAVIVTKEVWQDALCVQRFPYQPQCFSRAFVNSLINDFKKRSRPCITHASISMKRPLYFNEIISLYKVCAVQVHREESGMKCLCHICINFTMLFSPCADERLPQSVWLGSTCTMQSQTSTVERGNGWKLAHFRQKVLAWNKADWEMAGKLHDEW